MYEERMAISFIGHSSVCACCLIMCIACRILIYFPLLLLVFEITMRQIEKHVYIFKEIVVCDMRKEHVSYVLAR